VRAAPVRARNTKATPTATSVPTARTANPAALRGLVLAFGVPARVDIRGPRCGPYRRPGWSCLWCRGAASASLGRGERSAKAHHRERQTPGGTDASVAPVKPAVASGDAHDRRPVVDGCARPGRLAVWLRARCSCGRIRAISLEFEPRRGRRRAGAEGERGDDAGRDAVVGGHADCLLWLSIAVCDPIAGDHGFCW
jgi:hypothetical protein